MPIKPYLRLKLVIHPFNLSQLSIYAFFKKVHQLILNILISLYYKKTALTFNIKNEKNWYKWFRKNRKVCC